MIVTMYYSAFLYNIFATFVCFDSKVEQHLNMYEQTKILHN